MNTIIFIVILLVLVLVHELGHFATAKWFKVRVDEFGFGFPPKAMTLFKRGETEYTLNWLPIGGFVKIFGEEVSDDATNGPEASRSFINKPKWQQAIILVAGIAANFLLAWLLFSVSFMSGLPSSVQGAPANAKLTNVQLTVVSVLKDSPAYEGGVKAGDQIISIQSGKDIEYNLNPESLKKFIVAHGESEILVQYMRKNYIDPGTHTVKPELNDAGVPSIGIAMDEIGTMRLPFFGAFVAGAELTWNVTKGTVTGLYGIIKSAVTGAGGIRDSITGPVGMVKVVGDASQFGFAYLLSFAALISVNLAVINFIPFPALDGGRLLFVLIEKIKGSRISPNVANVANMVGFWLLILLMVFVTYNDIAKLI